MSLLRRTVRTRTIAAEKKAVFRFRISSLLAIFWLAIPLAPLWASPLENHSSGAPVMEERVKPENKSVTWEGLRPQTESSPLAGLSTLRHVKHRVRPGESLVRLFLRFGLKLQERELWLGAIQRHHPMKALHPGQELDFYFEKGGPSPDAAKGKEILKALEIEFNEDWILTWEKGSQGIVFSKREKPSDVELKTAAGVVETSLAEDGSRIGLQAGLVSQLADIFSWEIDLHKDIRPGDTFKLVYEQK